MFNLLKYEIKGRSKFIALLFLIYLLEHIYVVGFKLSRSQYLSGDGLAASVMLNTFITTLIFIAILFIYNILNYSKLLNPNPGYMLFMTNVPKAKIIISKLITMFIELFILGFASFTLLIIGLKSLDLINLIMFKDMLGFLIQGNIYYMYSYIFRTVFYGATGFLMVVSVFMLAITLRQFLFKDKSLGGLLTGVITIIIFMMKNYIYDLLNISFFRGLIMGNQEVWDLVANPYINSINLIILADMVFVATVFGAIVYLLEKKINI